MGAMFSLYMWQGGTSVVQCVWNTLKWYQTFPLTWAIVLYNAAPRYRCPRMHLCTSCTALVFNNVKWILYGKKKKICVFARKISGDHRWLEVARQTKNNIVIGITYWNGFSLVLAHSYSTNIDNSPWVHKINLVLY